MGKSRKARLLPQARTLYMGGTDLASISDLLEVPDRTLARWKAADRKAGMDWDAERSKQLNWRPDQMVAALRERMQDIVSDRSRDVASIADSVWKLERTIANISGTLDDPDMVLAVLHRFAEWCAEHIDEARRTVLAEVMEAYFDAHTERKA